MTVNFENSPVYVNSGIRQLVNKAINLFCLEDVDFDFNISNMMKMASTGLCWYPDMDNRKPKIRIGRNKGGDNKVRGSTIVHELIHMMNYRHTREINGTHDYNHIHYEATKFGRTHGEVDTYSRLVLKDLTGKYEVFL